MLLGMLVGSRLDLRMAVAVSMIVYVANNAYLIIGLRETLPSDRRPPLQFGKLIPLRGLSIVIRNSQLRCLCAVFVISEFAGAGLGVISISYYQKYLTWESKDN